MIRVENLRKEYADVVALNGVSFEVPRGELFGLLGPNGAGKTTTVGILSTLTLPSSGQATVAGIDVLAEPLEVRRHIGMVFQERTLDEHLSVRQNLAIHARLYGFRGKEERRRVERALSLFHMEDRADNEVAELSGGLKRRIELARSVVHEPDVLFLDEPTLGLDPEARRSFWDHARTLQRAGMTILVTTHYMGEAELFDRVAILNHGQLAVCDTPRALRERVGGDVLIIETSRPEDVVARLRDWVDNANIQVGDSRVYVRRPAIYRLVPEVVERADDLVEGIALREPTLEDAFIKLTGENHDLINGKVQLQPERMRRHAG